MELSRLESLPTELIQNIFLHCLEFNLPLSSIYLARALSDHAIYTWLLRLAFTSTVSDFIVTAPDYLPAPLSFHLQRDLQPQPQPETDTQPEPEPEYTLKNRILACRWCTLSLLREGQREFLKRVALHIQREYILDTKDHDALSSIERRFEDLVLKPGVYAPDPMRVDLALSAKLPGRKRRRSIYVLLDFGAVLVGGSVHKFPNIDLTGAARVPDRLLCAPWTDRKMEFLRLLLLSGAHIDEGIDFDRSHALLDRVVADRDFVTFQRLLDMGTRRKVSKDTEPWPLLARHFRLALKYADDHGDDRFVRLLVDQWWDSVPDDVQLKEDLLSSYS